jgi:predicted nucleic acid-binding protein
MINILLDTNVVIDLLIDRQPFSIAAARIFDYAAKKRVRLLLTAVSYNNIYYIVKKQSTHKETIKILKSLGEYTEIIDTTKETILSALNSDFNDFEDAIQYFCGKSLKTLHVIATRDLKGFKYGNIPVMTPEQVISFIETIK